MAAEAEAARAGEAEQLSKMGATLLLSCTGVVSFEGWYL